MSFQIRNYLFVWPAINRIKEPRRFSLISGILVFASMILYAYDPATASLYPDSPFRELTGLYCPGCGTLRGLHQILHGNVKAAFALNPLMVACLPFVFWYYIKYAIEILAKKQVPKFFIPSKWIWFFLYFIIAYGILRNIPLTPFSWLAPSIS
jgi:hypothetical protein